MIEAWSLCYCTASAPSPTGPEAPHRLVLFKTWLVPPRGCAKGRDQECDGLSPPLVNPRNGRPCDPRAVLENGDQDKERAGGGLGVLRPILSFWVIETPWLAPGR